MSQLLNFTENSFMMQLCTAVLCYQYTDNMVHVLADLATI